MIKDYQTQTVLRLLRIPIYTCPTDGILKSPYTNIGEWYSHNIVACFGREWEYWEWAQLWGDVRRDAANILICSDTTGQICGQTSQDNAAFTSGAKKQNGHPCYPVPLGGDVLTDNTSNTLCFAEKTQGQSNPGSPSRISAA